MRYSFASVIVVLTTVLAAGVLLGFAPLAGRCAGTGGTGPTPTLSCTGECTDCPDTSHSEPPHVNGSGEAYCGCSSTQEPACCHLVIEGYGGGNPEYGTNGTCTVCPLQGTCTFVTVGEEVQTQCPASEPH